MTAEHGRWRAAGVYLAVAAMMAALAALVSALRWWYAVVTVHGPSMAPALADGDRLLARRCGASALRTGSLVIFLEPGLERTDPRPARLTSAAGNLWVVKRVAAVAGEPVPDSVKPAVNGATVVPRRAIVVLGDNPLSRDSRQWGFIPASLILGKAVRRL
jgi:signal peptidase I